MFKTCDQSDTNNLDTAPNTVSHTGLFVPKFVMSNSHRQVTHPWQLEKLLPGLLFFCTQMPTFTWRILFTVQTYLFFLEYSKKTCIFFMYIHILGQWALSYILFSFGTNDSFLTGHGRNQVYSAYCYIQTAHKPVKNSSAKQTRRDKRLLSKDIYIRWFRIFLDFKVSRYCEGYNFWSVWGP